MFVREGGAPGPWGLRWPTAALVVLVAACGLIGGAAPEEAGAATARVATASSLQTLVNLERRSRGLGAVRTQTQLTRAAAGHSGDMVTRGYASHTSPEGTTLRGRIRRAGYLRDVRSWVLGEVIAWGIGPTATPSGIVAALMASPTHRAILLDPAVTQVGIGIAPGLPLAGGAGRGVTVTLDFGVRHRAR